MIQIHSELYHRRVRAVCTCKLRVVWFGQQGTFDDFNEMAMQYGCVALVSKSDEI